VSSFALCGLNNRLAEPDARAVQLLLSFIAAYLKAFRIKGALLGLDDKRFDKQEAAVHKHLL